MSSRSGKRLVKWMGWNLKASSAKKKAPIRLAVRRVRQIALFLRVRPDVAILLEVGSPNQAASLSKQLIRAGSALRRVPNGGAWRYIYVNPKVVSIIASGLHHMTHRWQGDDKPIVWAVGVVRGRRSIFIGAHLENLGPTWLKVQQADDVQDLAEHLKTRFRVSWKDVYVYLDGNDPTGAVRRKLMSGPLTLVERKAKRRRGTAWQSHNGWRRRLGRGRKVAPGDESIDLMLCGEDRPHASVTQYDTHNSSDHDAKSATAVFD